MLWLIVGLLVSLVALLLAVALMARHIRRHRKKTGIAGASTAPETTDEIDTESEP